MSKIVLITGGTGLIGQRLTQMLLAEGYQVRYLSRSKKSYSQVEVFQWDVSKDQIEAKALQGVDYIIHLAGAGVADKRWTADRKTEILESRTKSAALIAKALKQQNTLPQAFVSAAGISIYGHDTGNTLLSEDSPQNEQDFLGRVAVAWEKAANQIADLGIRTTKMRIGIVLSAKGGALPKLTQPIRWGAGAALGSGSQYMSWIHIDDLCRMFMFAMEHTTMEGAYNAVGPQPVTNTYMTQIAAKVLNRPLMLPNVPSFALNLMFGEISDLVLGGNKVSSQKIEKAGFQFQYTDLKQALENLLV